MKRARVTSVTSVSLQTENRWNDFLDFAVWIVVTPV